MKDAPRRTRGLARFAAMRLLTLVPVLWAVVTLTFLLMRMAPGGPFSGEKALPPETLARMEAHFGLDLPPWQQYARYVLRAARGDLGPSLKYPAQTVNDIIAERFPVSLQLGLPALLLALTLGLTAGTVAALRPGGAADRLLMSAAMAGICVPNFVLGPLLVLLFAVTFGWVPVAGWESPLSRILPACTLAAPYAAAIARLTRGGLLDVLPQDYIRTARARGLSESAILWRHALRNAMLPVAAYLGPATAGIVTGSFVVETIFQVPGLGQMFVVGATNRDHLLVQGLVAFYAALVVLLNLGADLLLAWLDPRIRRGMAGEGQVGA